MQICQNVLLIGFLFLSIDRVSLDPSSHHPMAQPGLLMPSTWTGTNNLGGHEHIWLLVLDQWPYKLLTKHLVDWSKYLIIVFYFSVDSSSRHPLAKVSQVMPSTTPAGKLGEQVRTILMMLRGVINIFGLAKFLTFSRDMYRKEIGTSSPFVRQNDTWSSCLLLD